MWNTHPQSHLHPNPQRTKNDVLENSESGNLNGKEACKGIK
jgi:hypothetical protein